MFSGIATCSTIALAAVRIDNRSPAVQRYNEAVVEQKNHDTAAACVALRTWPAYAVAVSFPTQFGDPLVQTLIRLIVRHHSFAQHHHSCGALGLIAR